MIGRTGLLGKCRLVVAFFRWAPLDRLTFHHSRRRPGVPVTVDGARYRHLGGGAVIHDSESTGPVAFGAPGMEPRWTRGNKEGIGTAYSTASRVWFTVWDGILTEAYYPTVDRPQLRDLQYLMTDGKTFFHEEKRHLESKLERLSDHGLGYRCTNSDPAGRYAIVKGSRNNNLNEAGRNILSTRFESVVPVRVSLVPTDPEFFHLGLCHFNASFILIGVENCLNL